MFDETDSDFDSSVDALLSWKPPKPTIDIDDIAEIERFLFGDQISLDMVDQCGFDVDLFNEDSNAASNLALFIPSRDSSSDVELPINIDPETQIRLESLLEAAGVGKLSEADGKAFTDPRVVQRLTASLSSALEEATAAFSNMKNEASSSMEQNEKIAWNSESNVFSSLPVLQETENFNDGKSLLVLACVAGYHELAEVLLSVPPYADESTYLTNESSQKLREKINERFLSTLNQQLTKVLLSAHADARDGCDNEEKSPLMEAASNGFDNIVSLILSHGAHVNETSSNGNTALNYASISGHDEVVKILIDHDAETEHYSNLGLTPLMQASRANHVTVASILIAHGADINAKSRDSKCSPLILASEQGHVEMVKLLIQSGADTENKINSKNSALMVACESGHAEVAQLLLDAGVSVSKHADCFDSPLSVAVAAGRSSVVELLIERGALLEERNEKGFTPLMTATSNGQSEMVKLLLSKSTATQRNINNTTSTQQITALSLACASGDIDCAKMLVECGADLEIGKHTPLMEACKENHLEIVKYLCANGANVNAVAENGDTAVALTCKLGNLKIADFLMSNGAYINLENQTRNSPLIVAVNSGHLNIVQLLVKKGANLHQTTADKQHTALSLACYHGHSRIVEFLLSQGADPFDKPMQLQDGSTVLLEAVKGGHAQVVKLLLDFSNKHANQLTGPSHAQICSKKVGSTGRRLQRSASDTSSETLCLCTTKLPTSTYRCVSSNNSFKTDLTFDQTLGGYSSGLTNKSLSNADILSEIDKFLQSVTSPSGVTYSHFDDSVLEEAQTKLTALNQLIKDAIEKNDNLKKTAAQDQRLSREEIRRHFLSHEEELLKKKETLEKLQEVKRGLKPKPNTSLSQTPLLSEPLYHSKKKRYCRSYTNLTENGLKCRRNFDEKVMSFSRRHSVSVGTTDCFLSLPIVNERDKTSKKCLYSLPSSLRTNASTTDLRTNASTCHIASYVNGCTNSNLVSPLSLAASQGNVEIIKLLLLEGADIYHRDKKGFIPLHSAVIAGHVEAALMLLDADADVDAVSFPSNDSPLSLACINNCLEAAKMLLGRGANIEHRNDSDYSPLCLAASSGFFELVRLLVENGADVNSRPTSKLGIAPIILAAMNGHSKIVKLLIDMGANVNAQIESNRATSLTLACFHGQHEVVQILVENDADLEHRSKAGLTPLMEAATGGHCEIGTLLLNSGAEPNASPVPSNRNTALIIAVEKKHFSFCKLLLFRGAHAEVKNRKGNSPLWFACHNGSLEVAKLLVDKGADVNTPDNKNITPLVAAIKQGHLKVVKWLSQKVSHFPSDADCARYLATASNNDVVKRMIECVNSMRHVKTTQEKEANKCASKLLEELHVEKSQEEDRKQKAAKKREKRRLKKTKKSEREDDKVYSVNVKEKNPQQMKNNDAPPRKKDINENAASSANISQSVETLSVSTKMKSLNDGLNILSSANLKPRIIESKKEPEKINAGKNYGASNENCKNKESSSQPSLSVQQAIGKPIMREKLKTNIKKHGVLSQIKRMVIASNLVSRVIGRAGCNVNAIRHVTGAEIDIDTMRKGEQQRTITLKGTTKAIFQAQQLISGLVAKKKSETKLSSHQATSSLKSPQKQQEQIKRTTQTLVAAPVPARPAWVVPLSFLVRANQKGQVYRPYDVFSATQSYVQTKTLSSKASFCISDTVITTVSTDKVENTSPSQLFAPLVNPQANPTFASNAKITQVTLDQRRSDYIQSQTFFPQYRQTSSLIREEADDVVSGFNSTSFQTSSRFPTRKSPSHNNKFVDRPTWSGCRSESNPTAASYTETLTAVHAPIIRQQRSPTTPCCLENTNHSNPVIQSTSIQNNLRLTRASFAGFEQFCNTKTTFDNAFKSAHSHNSNLEHSPTHSCSSGSSGFDDLANLWRNSSPTSRRNSEPCFHLNAVVSEESQSKLNSTSKPKPIGIERANRETLSFVTPPPPSDACQVDLWSYDKLTPDQLGISPRKESKVEDLSSNIDWYDKRFASNSSHSFHDWSTLSPLQALTKSRQQTHPILASSLPYDYNVADNANFNGIAMRPSTLQIWNPVQSHTLLDFHNSNNFAHCSKTATVGMMTNTTPKQCMKRSESARYSWPHFGTEFNQAHVENLQAFIDNKQWKPFDSKNCV